jgi:penicillin-binding protein 1C
VGNADGEGRPGLTGTDAAAPLMFDIFALLPISSWYNAPLMEMESIATCSSSGYRVSRFCTSTDTIYVHKNGIGTITCPYHKNIHLSENSRFRVHDKCYEVSSINHVSWFVLPAVQEFYFKRANSWYDPLPPFMEGCIAGQSSASMDILYPRQHAKLFIPKQLDGQVTSSVFELVHRNPNAVVYWHLDGNYLGSTQARHHLEISPPVGKHKLTLVDDAGETIERSFEVMSRL